MTLDSLAFTSSSRLRALVCPIGRIKRTRFLSFIERLQTETVVRLGDVSPDSKPNRTMFSPQGFPHGQIVYDLTTTYDRDHEYLEPFELYRRTFLVIAVADFTEDNLEADLLAQFEELRAIYRRALFHTCLIFDSPGDAPLPSPKTRPNDDRDTSKYFIPVPTKRESRTTSMRTIMCDITSCLLSEFTSFARTLQSLPTIESPLSGGVPDGDGTVVATTTTTANHRMSMPSLAGSSVIAGLGQQRMSIQGFGSGSITERARSKGKGRVQIAIGELYLLAGRIPDALKEFVDGASVAKSHNDHLWHGKALDGIGVSLVILTYLGVDFQIPNIPYPTLDTKASAKPATPPPKTGTPVSETVDPSRSSSSSADPQQLIELIPELGNTILNLYNRSSNFQGETIPQLCYFETVIRISKFMTTLYLASGLNTSSMSHMVLGTGIETSKDKKPRGFPTRGDIATSVMRAYPSAIETLTVLDASRVLGGIASVLGAIKFKRRKAMITQELVRILIPGLIQARVIGAAEAGIHPAAGLQAGAIPAAGAGGALDSMEQEMDIGIIGLLEDMCAAYGILRKSEAAAGGEQRAAEAPTIGESIVAENELRAFGWGSLKVHVLRNCMSLCEALPDFHGLLNFTAQLLRMGGADLSKEEQLKLATSLSRTVGASKKLGLAGIETEYWDAFLVRDVEIVESSMWIPPIPHANHELRRAGIDDALVPAVVDKTPFIYNPFSKKREGAPAAAELVLVQDELAEFRVTLQNPYEFDVEIESIELDVKGVEFETEQSGVVLSPYRTQQLSIFGKPTGSGSMVVTGCRVRVFGCNEKAFPIFNEGFDSSKFDIKVKRTGLAVLDPKPPVPAIVAVAKKLTKQQPPQNQPIPKTIPVTIIDCQPLLIARTSSLPQSAVMVLEGERKIFNIVFQNLTSVPVDLLFFSFQDSTTTQLQAALQSANMQPAEIYEYEVLLMKKRAFVWKSQHKQMGSGSIKKEDGEYESESNTVAKENNSVLYIPALGSASFDIEVLGKPGLTSGSVQLDYGHLGRPRDEITGKFYTRQVVFPVTVTVNASIEVVRVDFLPFAASVHFAGLKELEGETQEVSSTIHNDQYRELFRRISMSEDSSDYCLMTLDLRNAWPQTLKAKLTVRDPLSSDTELENWDSSYEVGESIQAGHTTRLVLPIRRLLITHPTKKIPSISGHQRQFVVSTSRPSAEQERISRESFWFREEVLKCLRGRWEEVGSKSVGEIELRNFRMTSRMVETIRVDDVGIRMNICPTSPSPSSSDSEPNTPSASESPSSYNNPLKIGPSKYIVNTDEFLTLRTTITNRTNRSMQTILRICPSIRNQHPLPVALDLSRRLAFNGLLQHAVKKLEPGEFTVVETGFVAICKGEYEISTGVEEIRTGGGGGEIGDLIAEGEKNSGKLGPDGIPEDLVEMAIGKRSWVSRELCVLLVRDGGV